MKVGDIVTINVEYAAGTEIYVKGETGVILECDKKDGSFVVATGNPSTTELWFDESEVRFATDEEVRGRLRYVLMD